MTDQTFEVSDKNIKFQYELLNILDAKASAHLAFNAIFLASISIWLGYVPLNWMHLALDLVFLLLLTSTYFDLRVIYLKWSKTDESIDDLEAVRKYRTRRYITAWWLSLISIAAVFAVSSVHALGTALIASGNCGELCTKFYDPSVFGGLDTRGS